MPQFNAINSRVVTQTHNCHSDGEDFWSHGTTTSLRIARTESVFALVPYSRLSTAFVVPLSAFATSQRSGSTLFRHYSMRVYCNSTVVQMLDLYLGRCGWMWRHMKRCAQNNLLLVERDVFGVSSFSWFGYIQPMQTTPTRVAAHAHASTYATRILPYQDDWGAVFACKTTCNTDNRVKWWLPVSRLVQFHATCGRMNMVLVHVELYVFSCGVRHLH